MKSSKAIVLALLGVVVIAGGIWAFVLSGDEQSNNNQAATSPTTSQLASVEIPKSETEKMLEGYYGEEYERYYIANMIAHHQGAVDMARLSLTNAKHAELKNLANNIISTQNTEINNMINWQKQWGYPVSSGEMMEDHSAMVMMDDMAATMEQHKTKTGDDFDKSFLILMIEHHESAVAMSRPGINNASHQEVKDLAKAIIAAQTSEIAQMRQWQKDWGYKG